MPRIYFTFSVKTIKREPPINRASPRTTTNVYICRRKRKKRKKKLARNEEEEIWKFAIRRSFLETFLEKIVRNLWKNFHAISSVVYSKCILEIVHDSPRMFYQNTLWYRRRFKGDGTMFTECRGADRRMEGRVYRGMPLVGLSCKPFPRAKPAPPRLLYIPFHSHL